MIDDDAKMILADMDTPTQIPKFDEEENDSDDMDSPVNETKSVSMKYLMMMLKCYSQIWTHQLLIQIIKTKYLMMMLKCYCRYGRTC